MRQVNITDNSKDTCLALTQNLIWLLKSIPKRDVYIAISGGNTPIELFDYWAERYVYTINWKRIHLFWVDERCVSPNDQESNYYQASQHLLNKLPLIKKHIHRIHGESNPQLEANRYSEIVRKLLPWNNTLPVFDLIILGLGNDGHTASLFPSIESSITKDKFEEPLSIDLHYQHELQTIPTPIYLVTENPYTHQLRISMSLSLINQAQNIYFFILGAEKKEVFAHLFRATPESFQYPSFYVKPISGNLIYFLNREAVSSACICCK